MVNLLSILLLGLPEIVRRPDLADCLHYIPRKKKVFFCLDKTGVVL